MLHRFVLCSALLCWLLSAKAQQPGLQPAFDSAFQAVSRADLFAQSKSFEAAEILYRQALTAARRLAARDASRYSLFRARTALKLASLFQQQQKPEQAGEFLLEAWSVLAPQTDENVLPSQASTLLELGKNALELANDSSAQFYTRQALELFESLAEKNAPRYEPDIAQSAHLLARSFMKEKKWVESEDMLAYALEIYEKYTISDPEKFAHRTAEVYADIGLFFLLKNDEKKAPQAFKKALDLGLDFSRWIPQRPNINPSIIYEILQGLAKKPEGF